MLPDPVRELDGTIGREARGLPGVGLEVAAGGAAVDHDRPQVLLAELDPEPEARLGRAGEPAGDEDLEPVAREGRDEACLHLGPAFGAGRAGHGTGLREEGRRQETWAARPA